jgi:DNA-binding NtrC family response regulator
VSAIKIDKITVWDSGNGREGASTAGFLSGLIRSLPPLQELADMAVLDTEAQAIRLALHATRGNKSEAARLLKVDYKTLHLKMKRFGIQAGAFRAS